MPATGSNPGFARIISRAAATLSCFMLMAPAAGAAQRLGAEELIARWQEANGFCRGYSGDDPETWAWCKIRDGIDEVLTVRGYCYGKQGQPASDMLWHACAAGSIPGKPPKNPYE